MSKKQLLGYSTGLPSSQPKAMSPTVSLPAPWAAAGPAGNAVRATNSAGRRQSPGFDPLFMMVCSNCVQYGASRRTPAVQESGNYVASQWPPLQITPTPQQSQPSSQSPPSGTQQCLPTAWSHPFSLLATWQTRSPWHVYDFVHTCRTTLLSVPFFFFFLCLRWCLPASASSSPSAVAPRPRPRPPAAMVLIASRRDDMPASTREIASNRALSITNSVRSVSLSSTGVKSIAVVYPGIWQWSAHR